MSDVYVGADGKLHKVIGGADTVLNFSRSAEFKSVHHYAVNGASNSFTYTVPDGVSNIVAMYHRGAGSVSLASGYYLLVPINEGYDSNAAFYKVKKGQNYTFSISSSKGSATYIQICAG